MSVEQDIDHPPASRLDAVAAGDDAGPIAMHLDACEACTAYVSGLKSEAEAFRAGTDSVAFAEAIRRRATAREARGVAKIVWVVAPAVAAAVVALWLGGPSRVEPVSADSTLTPSASSTSSSSDVARFKGGLSVAVIRDRGGRQERLTGPFEVVASDRIRIEIDLDRDAPITAGLLSDDGTWTRLQSPAALGIGTHYSDLSARFDDSPMDATLLVGSPADVDRARRLRDFGSVVAWRIKSTLAR